MKKTLALVFLGGSIIFAGCASSGASRYAKLKESEECVSSFSKINLSWAKTLRPDAKTEGEINDEHCIQLPSFRSGYDVFRYKTATNTSVALQIRVFQKPRGFGFGGQHTLMIPVVNILTPNGQLIAALRNQSLKLDKNAWSGDRYFYGYTVEKLQPNTEYYFVVTTDNHAIGQRLTKSSFSTYAGGVVLSNDASLFIGPFGSMEVEQK